MQTAEHMGPRLGSSGEPHLSEADFTRIARFVEGHCAIRMPPSKRIMVESRLRKRLRAVGAAGFRAYIELVFAPGGESELVHLVDSITTNKTDFFREPQHFEYLLRTAVPELIRSRGAGLRRPLAVWSAGCSSGEEPYTLAMVLMEVAEGLPGFQFRILATDISTAVLQKAQRAVYEEERVEPVPLPLRRKYLLRGRNRRLSLVRIAPEVRRRVSFRRLNFLDGQFGFREALDVIFCRNVMIYFDRSTQEALLRRFCGHLTPDGYVFLGHSESINGLRVPLRQVAPTVYRHTADG